MLSSQRSKLYPFQSVRNVSTSRGQHGMQHSAWCRNVVLSTWLRLRTCKIQRPCHSELLSWHAAMIPPEIQRPCHSELLSWHAAMIQPGIRFHVSAPWCGPPTGKLRVVAYTAYLRAIFLVSNTMPKKGRAVDGPSTFSRASGTPR